MTTGYCVKCRSKREIKGATAVTMKNGKEINYNQKNVLHPNLIVANSMIHKKIIDYIS